MTTSQNSSVMTAANKSLIASAPKLSVTMLAVAGGWWLEGGWVFFFLVSFMAVGCCAICTG